MTVYTKRCTSYSSNKVNTRAFHSSGEGCIMKKNCHAKPLCLLESRGSELSKMVQHEILGVRPEVLDRLEVGQVGEVLPPWSFEISL